MDFFRLMALIFSLLHWRLSIHYLLFSYLLLVSSSCPLYYFISFNTVFFLSLSLLRGPLLWITGQHKMTTRGKLTASSSLGKTEFLSRLLQPIDATTGILLLHQLACHFCSYLIAISDLWASEDSCWGWTRTLCNHQICSSRLVEKVFTSFTLGKGPIY